jgi:hypothetical protein
MVVVALSPATFAQGQATVTAGWASNVGVSGYTYGAPFVPQIVTPSISFSTYSANPVGATNGTAGNIAGAANSTIENGQGAYSSVTTVPVWYGPGVPDVSAEHGFGPMPMHHMHDAHHGMPEGARYFNFGSSRFEYRSVGERASMAKADLKKAGRSYGNADVERQNQNNGVVKYRGKTENIG